MTDAEIIDELRAENAKLRWLNRVHLTLTALVGEFVLFLWLLSKFGVL